MPAALSRGDREPCLDCKGPLPAALLQGGQQQKEAQRPNPAQLTPQDHPAQASAASPCSKEDTEPALKTAAKQGSPKGNVIKKIPRSRNAP